MMLMFRRGGPGLSSGSIVDIDLTLELPGDRVRPRMSHEPWRPAVEVYESPAELVVRVEIAGLSTGSIEVLTKQNELEVRGERHVSPCDHRRRFHESHIRYGPFRALVHLPFPIDERLASADYRDGILTVALPRLVAATISASAEDESPVNTTETERR